MTLQGPKDLTPEEATQLWRFAKSGDRDSLGRLLNHLQDTIFRFCWAQLGDESWSVEATQETAARLIKNLDQFQGESKLTTWVMGIANNVCREFRRKDGRWLQVSGSDLEEQGELGRQLDSIIEGETKSAVHIAVLELPDRQREAIILRFFESLSINEIAQVMKIADGTVKATISAALKNLEKKIEPK